MINILDFVDIATKLHESGKHQFVKVFKKDKNRATKKVWITLECDMTNKNFEEFQKFIDIFMNTSLCDNNAGENISNIFKDSFSLTAQND